jgi:hypothetical protein
MTTEERYVFNPTRTQAQEGFDYEPYTHSDYKHMMSRYQNMQLPRGLGHTETERWKVEVSDFLTVISKKRGQE